MMPSLGRTVFRTILAAALVIGSAGSSARAGGDGSGAARRAAPPWPYVVHVPIRVIDGRMDDWPDGVAAVADEHYVYLRFRIEPRGDGGPTTLQSSDETLTLLLDLDGNSATGRRESSEAWRVDLGVDVRIEFSPRGREGPGRGVGLTAYDWLGNAQRISHADADFMVAPAYASEWYEARIARRLSVDRPEPAEPEAEASASEPLIPPDSSEPTPLLGVLPAPSAWRLGAGTGRGVLRLADAGDELIARSELFEFAMPPGSREDRRSHSPVPPGLATRLVSWNVLRASPMSEPEPFARVLRALEPDIVLVQEWDGVDSEGLAAWFEAHVGGAWNAIAKPEQGVGIVARGEILATDTGDYVPIRGEEWPVRYVGATVRTAWRDTAVASVHLKCCGSNGSPEDERRLSEAKIINTVFEQLVPGPRATRVIGGDLNLVGSRPPIDRLRAKLDADGSALEPVETIVLGDNAIYTWRNPDSSFSPGRLDYVLYSDANAMVVGAFVLDTGRLSEDALAALGLRRGDTGASDHLPVVVDLRPTGKEPAGLHRPE